jgi:hypothetical protein
MLSQAEEAAGDEEKSEVDLVDRARKYSHFCRNAGRALAQSLQHDLPTQWTGPQCELTLQTTADDVIFIGDYEVAASGLSALSLGDALTGRIASPLKYRVEYRGTLRGSVIVGTVTRNRADETAPVKTLLGTIERQPTPVMLRILEDGRTIEALEGLSNGEPRTSEWVAKN